MFARTILVVIPAVALIAGCAETTTPPPPTPVVAPPEPAKPGPGTKDTSVAPPATTSQKTL